MKKLLFMTSLLLMMIGMNSCYSVKNVSLKDDYQHACKGMTKTEIISKFGEPTREAVIDGQQALVYESFIDPGKGTKQNSIQYAGQWMESRRYLEIYFDAEGRCNRVETNLTKEERFKDEKKTNRVVWGSVAGAAVATAIGVTLGVLLPQMLRK